MPTLLTITDGTTTIDFVSSTSGYKVTSWNPAVAKRRRNLLGGAGPYEDVDEEMEITIHGTDALTKLSSLQGLLEQSQRWYRGEPVSAVLLRYEPEASSADTLNAVIVGDSGREMIELPRNFPDSPVYDYIDPIVLRFRRRGLWSRDSDEAGTATDEVSPTVMTIGAGAATAYPVESPMLLEVSITTGVAAYAYSYILTASAATTTAAANRLILFEARDLTSGQFTTSADATNKAVGNTVLRFTAATTTGFYSSTTKSLSAADTSVRRWGVYLNYRSNTTLGDFHIRYYIDSNYSRITPIAAGTNNPQWAYLGSVSLTTAARVFALQAKCLTSTSATLDFNSIVLQAQDYTTDHALYLRPGSPASISDYYLTINPHILTQPHAEAYLGSTAGEDSYPAYYTGDAFLTMRGGGIAVLWLTRGNQSYTTTRPYWRATDSAGTLIEASFNAEIWEGYITPE